MAWTEDLAGGGRGEDQRWRVRRSGGGESYEAEQLPEVPTVARTLGLRTKTRASVILPDTVKISCYSQSHCGIGPGRSLH